MMHVVDRKTRSKTGCRTCRIRKVKCDEEKIVVGGKQEPQCRRCSVARILCEWKGGPVPRKPAKGLVKRNTKAGSNDRLLEVSDTQNSFSPVNNSFIANDSRSCVQAANSLTLSGFDRSCLDYLRDSVLVILLGKHWPWSTISYTYHKIAAREPMVLSMILATSASEIHRSRLYDSDTGNLPIDPLSDVDGRKHYGRAISYLRGTLKQDVKSPGRLEALFITLWLMIDYENRFGSGTDAINVHMRGITTLLFNHVVPSLKTAGSLSISSNEERGTRLLPEKAQQSQTAIDENATGKANLVSQRFDDRLRSTTVPLFLLWTLYFCTPGALFCGPGIARIDANLFRFFLCTENQSRSAALTLPELFKISRQSPSRFWGEEYPATAHLDDLENSPGLALYHKSHVVQFKITELFRQGDFVQGGVPGSSWDQSSYKRLINEMVGIADEYDTLLSSARAAPSCEIAGDGRRVLETIYWASITYYGTIVYFYLCFGDFTPAGYTQPRWLSRNEAVSQVLELALKLHRTRPRLMVRITWPLFMAGIATSDRIYQDWVSIRLQELGRYGQNFTRVSCRFDEIIQGCDPFACGPGQLSNFQRMQEIAVY